MLTPFVWVQLYHKEKEDPEGRVFKIKPVPDDVDALVDAVKDKLAPKLDSVPVDEIDVYPPKDADDTEKYNSDKELAELIEELKDKTPPTSCNHPLIVVAPAPDPTQQQQPPMSEQILTTIVENMQSLQSMQISQQKQSGQQLDLLKLLSEEVNKTRKSRLNCWERESLRTTGSKRDPNFRKNVIRHYKRGSNSGKSVKCQILDEYVCYDIARNTIIAVHIWKAETRGRFLDEFGLHKEDVNNVRNGIFVTKGIEAAFDNQQVCFLHNILSRELCLWVADTTIRSDTIEGSNPPKTFADVHQKPLRCPDEDHMPFRRLLAWHARLTLELRKGSIQVTNLTSEYDLSPGRAGATLDPIAQAIDDLVNPGEDASVSDREC